MSKNRKENSESKATDLANKLFLETVKTDKDKETSKKENTPSPKKEGNVFLDASKSTKKDLKDIKLSPEGIQGFKSTGETRFMNTKEYTDYTQDDRGIGAFPFQSNYEHSRAINQGAGEQLGNAVIRTVKNTPLEFLNQLGGALDFEDYINTDDEVGNILSTWAQEQKAEVDAENPIYRTDPNQALDIGDSAWWFQNGSGLVQSATAFVGLGYLTGGAALKSLTKVGETSKWLATLGKTAQLGDTGKKVVQGASGLANTIMLNQAEGVGMATNVFNDVYKEALEGLKSAKISGEVDENGNLIEDPNSPLPSYIKDAFNANLSNEEIEIKAKEIASGRAAKALNFNRFNILLNLSSSFAFLKTPKLTRQIVDKPTIANTLKNIGEEAVQEAGEETVNMLAEKYAKDENYNVDKGVNDIISLEGAESALLGAVGGMAQTALTSAGREIKLSKDSEGNRVSRNDKQRKRYAEQQDVFNRWQTLKEASDPKTSSDVFLNTQEAYQIYKDLNEAVENKDTKKTESLKNLLLANQAYDAFNSGTTESLINVYSGVASLTEEEAETKGLDKTTYKEKALEAIDTIKALENKFNASQEYVNSVQVYENEAAIVQLKQNNKRLATAKEANATEVIEGLQDLGYTEDVFSVDDSGNFIYTGEDNKSKEFKADLESLASHTSYVDTVKDIKANDEVKKTFTQNLNTFKSPKYQASFKSLMEAEKRKKETEQNKKEVQKKQRQNKEASNTKKEEFKKDLEEQDTVDTSENTSENNVTSEVETEGSIPSSPAKSSEFYTFKIPANIEGSAKLEKNINSFINGKKPLSEKISFLEKDITNLETAPPQYKGVLAQYRQALRKLTELQDETVKETEASTVVKENAKKQLEKIASLIEADLSPKKAKSNAEKTIEKVTLFNDMLDGLEKDGVDVGDFNKVANYASDVLGEDRFSKLFNDFKDIYNLSKRGERVESSYESIFYTPQEKKEALKNEALIDNTLLIELYNKSDIEYQQDYNKAIKEYIEEQGYTIYEKDGVVFGGIKTKEGFNKVAHLDKKYKKTITSTKTTNFNILNFVSSKEDLNNLLNANTDEALLDPSIITKGTSITFVPLNKIRYDDGTVVYKDGTVEKNGTKEKGSPDEIAPIGIKYNGKLLKGAFLHTVEWINEENIDDFNTIPSQKKALKGIRAAVLKAGEEGITTTITNRTDGWLLRDVEGERKPLKETLPDIEIGVGKGGVINTSVDTVVDTSNRTIHDGNVYAIIPVNDNKKIGVPVQRTALKDRPEYIESMTEAVKLYLYNNKKDEKVLELQEETGIDITTIKGLRDYLNIFIYLNPNMPFEFNDFKTFLNGVGEKVSVVRIADNNLEFGRGLGIGDTARFINRDIINKHHIKGNQLDTVGRDKTISDLLLKFRNVLENNTYINVDVHKKKQNFKLPLITKEALDIKEMAYEDYLKDNLSSDLYSHTLSNGKKIYTVQSSLEFDTSFARKPLKPKKKKLKEVNTKPATEKVLPPTSIKGFNPLADLSPLQLSEEQDQFLKDNTPESLLIQGVSVAVQNEIIDYLTLNILKNLNNGSSKEKALDIIDQLANKLNNVYIPYYKPLISQEGISEEVKEKLILNLSKLENVKANYNKLAVLALNNLRKYNNVSFNETELSRVQEQLQVLDFDLEVDIDEDAEAFNNYEADRVFKENFKDKMSTNIKNFFSAIEEVESIDENGNPVIATGSLGLEKLLSFDVVLNDIAGILAFDNYNVDGALNQPSFDNFVKILESRVESKPYMRLVLDKLETAPEQIKKEFVTIMSKHYTHHLYLYKNKKGSISLGNSDRNTISKQIQKTWLNSLYNQALIKEEKGTFIIDQDLLQDIEKTMQDVIEKVKTNDTTAVSDAVSFLSSIGMDFSEEQITSFIEDGIRYTKQHHSFLHMLSHPEGVVNLYLKRLKSIEDRDIRLEHPFGDNSSMDGFSRELAKKYPNYYANSFKDVEGNSYYAYSQNKMLINRMKELLNNPSLLEQLKNQPFSSTSYWLEQLQTNPKFKEAFNYFTFDGIANHGAKGKKLDNMSPAEIEEVKIALFYSLNKYETRDKAYRVQTFYPTTSDKTTQYVLSSLGIDFSKMFIPGTSNLNKTGLQTLYKTFALPEINRIYAHQLNGNRGLKGYDKGANSFIMIPQLNDLDSIWETVGDVKQLKNNLSSADKNAIVKVLVTYVNTLVDDKVATWKDYGFVETVTSQEVEGALVYDKKVEKLKYTLSKTNDKDVKQEATNYVLNYLLANVNTFQLFTTDPAFYYKGDKGDSISSHEATFNNMGKRLAADIAPAADMANEVEGTFNVAHVADNEKPALLYSYYEALLGQNATDYKKMNSTDAQEFTTLKEHLKILYSYGKIEESTMNELLRKEEAEETITSEDMEVIYQPLKPKYANNIWENGLERRLYIKSSSFPLFKQLTKGLQIDNLRKAMLAQKVDRVAFDSAIKVGGLSKPSSIYDKNGIKKNISLTVIENIPRKGWGIQQDVPYKESKTVINDGSQQRKLLLANLLNVTGFTKVEDPTKIYTGQEIQEALDTAYHSLFKLQYDNLIKEIGYDVDTNTINLKKLQSTLEAEALSRDYPLYDIEALKLKTNSTNGQESFVVPLWLTGVSGKLESMLNSIIDNRVRKIKPKGKSYVLGTPEGFSPVVIEGEEAKKEINNNTGIKYSKEWAEREDKTLLPMRVENGVVLPAEVILPFEFKDEKGNPLFLENYLTEDGFIDESKIDKSLLEIFAFRIPTQGLNSMAHVKIVGFLPKSSGDLFLAPADWTIQMGSDFDVDKIYTNSFHTSLNEETGKLDKYSGEESKKLLENTILDLHFSVLSNPAKEVQSAILKPLDFGMLPELGNEIEDIIEKANPSLKGIGLSEAYQTKKYLNARAGKLGIGVFSLDSTFSALAQNKGIYLSYKHKKHIYPYHFSLGNMTSNYVSDVETIAKTRNKSDVIAAFQSLAVDNENEQGMHKLNVNSHTFDTIRTMAMSGFEEDAISYFINQPIIRRFVALSKLAEDTVTPLKTTEIEETLLSEFVYNETLDRVQVDVTKGMSVKNLKISLTPITDPKRIDAYNFEQFKIYSLFKELQTYGKTIQSVQSAINTESGGVGKNLFYAVEKELQVNRLGNSTKIQNASRLIGDYQTFVSPGIPTSIDTTSPLSFLQQEWNSQELTEKRQQEIIKEVQDLGYYFVSPSVKQSDVTSNSFTVIKPATINGFASIYALRLNNRLWEKHFPYRNRKVLKVISAIKKTTGKGLQSNIAENAEISKTIFNSIKSSLITGQINTFNGSNETITELRNRLLIDTKDNTSLANIIKAVRDGNLLNNPFLSRLELDIFKEVLPSTVKYKANVAENVNERSIYASFLSMFLDDNTNLGVYNGIQYTPKVLAQELVTHQLITGGVQKANQFIKYIPINYLNSIGYYDALENLNLNNEDDFNTQATTTQYLQHNPKEVVISKSSEEDTKKLLRENGFQFFNEDTIIKKISFELDKDLNLPSVFSIPSETAVKGYKLYIIDPVIKAYKQVDTLGRGDFLEYDATASKAAETIIISNQAPRNPEIDLPTEPKKVKEVLSTKRDNTGEFIINTPEDTSIAGVYGLNDTLSSSEMFVNLLEKIIDKNKDPLKTIFAKELLSNIEKIADYEIEINPLLNAEGMHHMESKTIVINPSFTTDEGAFEDTVLEEIIHAFTKKALLNNNSGEVNRLKGFRSKAEQLVRAKLGKGADIKFKQTQRKINEGLALNDVEYNLIYPVLTDVEFVGRLIKSKELQKLLQEEVVSEGKSFLDTFWDFIKDVLESIGITRNSVLDYALTDILSIIKQPAPSSSVTGELQNLTKKTKTIAWVESFFNIREQNGKLKNFGNEKAIEIAKWVNNNTKNIEAQVYEGTVILTNNLDASPKKENSKLLPLLKSYNKRIKELERNINKAEVKEDFKKKEQLSELLESLLEKRDDLVATDLLIEAVSKGKQDMEEIEEMFKGDITLEDTLYIRKVLHFWTSASDLLFDEDDRQSQILLDKFASVKAEADRHEDKLVKVENDYMNKFIKTYGNDLTVTDIFNHFKDINNLQAHTLDISRSNNALLDSIYLSVKNANIDATDESNRIIEEIDALEKSVKPILKSLSSNGELYDVFRQKTNKGNLTGHLVSRYTADYLKDLRSVLKDVNTDRSSVSYARMLDWARNNTFDLNLNYLFPRFPLSDADKVKAEALKEKIKNQIGEPAFAEYLESQTKLINNYKKAEKGKIERVLEKYDLKTLKDIRQHKEANASLNIWLRLNSPYELYKHRSTTLPNYMDNLTGFNSVNYTTFIPSNPIHTDEAFKTIESNPKLLEFYNYYTKLDKELKSVMPSKDRLNLIYNGIPHVEKTLLKEYKAKGMKVGLAPIWDGMKKAIRKDEDSNITYSDLDPVTGLEDKQLRASVSKNNAEEIENYVYLKVSDYVIEKGTSPSSELQNQWREEAIDTLAQRKSYDLPKVLRVYAITVLAYKHKSRVEDTLLVAQNTLSRQEEYIRNNKGDIKTDLVGRDQKKNSEQSYTNTKKQLDYFMDVFYGKNREIEGETNTKVLTSEEKATKAEIVAQIEKADTSLEKGTITKENHKELVETLKTKMEDLGGVAVWSKRGDTALKYIQLKSMGWNIMSSVANAGFGFIANKLEASGGRLYTNAQLAKAYKMTMSSVYRNMTFNKGKTDTGLKIRNLMDKWDVLKDASKELFENPLSIEIGDRAEFLAPYNLTQRTEYINQAPVMIALMLNSSINIEGKEVNLWEAYDVDGKWKPEYGEEPKQQIKDLRIKLDQVIKMNHGNYDPSSPLLIKNKFMGRALAQFRTWMLEGFATRFEGEKWDATLKIHRKGRYRSALDYYVDRGVMGSLLDTFKGLLRSLTFGNVYKGATFAREGVSDVDAANMKKIMSEISMYLGLYTGVLLLKALSEGVDPEDEPIKAYVVNNLINQGTRLQTDIAFYISPGEFRNLLRDPVPVTSIIKDGIDFISSVEKAVKGEDVITTGVYSGHSRVFRETSQLLPFATQGYKTYNYGIQVFDK